MIRKYLMMKEGAKVGHLVGAEKWTLLALKKSERERGLLHLTSAQKKYAHICGQTIFKLCRQGQGGAGYLKKLRMSYMEAP